MVKVISLSEEAYRTLKRIKREGMSFSDVIMEYLVDDKTEKTETKEDLIMWLKSKKFSGKKEKISTNADEIIYGVKR